MDLHLQLEMPLEALVLRHPAAAAAGSLWACLAVLAAAFGLWRIRSAAVASRSDDRQTHTPKPPPEAPEKPQTSEAGKSSRPLAVGRGEQSPCVASPRKETLFEVRGCYELPVDDEDDQRGGDGAEGGALYCLHREEEDREADGGKPWAAAGPGSAFVYGGRGWGERWRDDQGWYLHQDVAALNGRVVRLWEDEKRLAASRLARRRRWEAAAW